MKRCDLLGLWKVSSRLSLLEVFTKPEDPFAAFPMLNSEKTRLFSQAVLSSSAVYTQDGVLPSSEDFRKIINDCNHILHDPDDLALVSSASGTDRAHLEFQRFFVRLAAQQFPGQRPDTWGDTGRLIAMFEVLPERHADRVPIAQQPQVRSVVASLEAVLGARLSDLAIAFADILAWQTFLAQKNHRLFSASGLTHAKENESEEHRAERQALYLLSLILPVPVLDELLVADLTHVLKMLDLVTPGYSSEAMPRVQAFLNLAARSAGELRSMLRLAEYQLGHHSKRLSPLERYPIVRVDPPGEWGAPTFVVPNYRHLLESFPSIVDFTLADSLGTDYQAARGALLHLYLRQLVEDRLPDIVIVPETKYDQARGAKDSPDLTLIDLRSGRLIAVEVKGRRINLATRISVSSEDLRNNLTDAFAALGRLAAKVTDLYSPRPEFSSWRAAIDQTRNAPPILVVVVREGLQFLSQFVSEEVKQDPLHPLRRVHDPYCLLSSGDFERAVEIARSSKQSLGHLLAEHNRRSGERDYQSSPAEWFGQDTHEILQDSFARNYWVRPAWMEKSA